MQRCFAAATSQQSAPSFSSTSSSFLFRRYTFNTSSTSSSFFRNPNSNTFYRMSQRGNATTTGGGAEAAGKPKLALRIKDLSKNEKMIVCVIFAITGSSAAALVRPMLAACRGSPLLQTYLGINQESGFIAGPMQYRVLYFSIMWPMYTVLLFTIGTIFGRRLFFSHFVAKMWGRVLPKPAAAGLRRLLKIE
jgi:hypothetical protein